MPATLARDSFVGPPPPPVEPNGGSGGGPDGRGSSRRTMAVLLAIAIAATCMVFIAFTSAFATLRSESETWMPVPLPGVLWWNTAILVLSSAALETARRMLHSGHRTAFNYFWTAGTLLGFGFLAGQALAWKQLSDAGVMIGRSTSTAFFYMLTAAHAAHLLGGLAAVSYVDAQALRYQLGPGKRTAVDMSARFWHFLDGVWIYILVLLYVWG